MTSHTRRSRRVWTEDGVVCLRDEDDMGNEIIREFVCRGNAVYDITRHPWGKQMCGCLTTQGFTLVSTPDALEDLIRREYRAACRERAKREKA